nr:sigma-70 family RNA polymerase sigma factor [uncultured Allomuricauda sp.]
MNIEKEFTEIYNKHASQVYRLCLGYASGNEDLAKEWQQQTFIKVWKHRSSYKGSAAIGTWIYRIAVNICLGDLRKVKKKAAVVDFMPITEDSENERHEKEEQIKKMYECIHQLPGKNKALIFMELEGIPQNTIGDTLGMAHGAVRTRLSRIRKVLLKCITNEKR